MGIHHKDGYSATVEAYFIVGEQRLQLVKPNSRSFLLAEPCELAPGTEGELVVVVDGDENRRSVSIPQGVAKGQTDVDYRVTAPF